MKRDILKKLREGVKLTSEEINIISKEFTREKKYGLVWEDHPEGVDLELKDGVFKIEELRDKKISMDPNGRENLLLEGDNLHSLMALKEAGVKVDVIYIDPPYNTLNEVGFRYNDKKIDSNDSYRHSKWLSFMYKRLELARELMEDDGVIFVSIDDNELYNLKLLMNQVFGEENFISNIIWRNKSGGGHDTKLMVNENEYILVFGKNKEKVLFRKNIANVKDDSRYKYQDKHIDTRGKYLLKQLDFASLGYIESLDFPIYSKEYNINIYPGEGKLDKTTRWRWSKEKVAWGLDNDFIEFKKNNNKVKVYSKQYQFVDNEGSPIERGTPYRNTIDFAGTSKGTLDLNNVMGRNLFNYPKPIDLISFLINLHSNKNITILDFFAGSGTTGQAVMELNKEDGGNRRFILCTNNENNICEEVTYERNRRVITGEYVEENVEPLPNNLSYYKVDIENIDDLNVYEKKELDNYRDIVQILWKNDYKIVNEEKEFIEVSNLDENSIIIKLDTIDGNFKSRIDFNRFNKIYAKKHLSREKSFKGIDEAKLIFY